MSFWQSLFGGTGCLGVDIGTTSIKMVEVTESSSIYRLKNYGLLESYGHLERVNDAIQTSSLKLFERETTNLLKTLLKQVKPSTKNVVASIPAFSSFVTLLDMPMMNDAETTKGMPFQARQYIPLPVSEVAIDWLKVGEKEDENGVKRQQVLLISVPNEQIKKYQMIFKAAGLTLVSLEIEGLALTRMLINGDQTPTLVMDIGARSTNILVTDGGHLKLVAQTDFAGGTLTQAVASGLDINVNRAEELKKLRGLLGSGGEYELSTLMFPYLDAIIGEAKRLRTRYETEYSGKLERVILTGGGANLPGIEEYIGEQIGLPTLKANPFSRVSYPDNLEPIIGELGPMFSVALGLAIRGLI
jgi:type IV pilus assembly protein PilM